MLMSSVHFVIIFELGIVFCVLQDFTDLHAVTLQVVANCLTDSESVQLIQKGGGLSRLMEFILTPSMPQIQSSAVKCITRVAQSCKHKDRWEINMCAFSLSLPICIFNECMFLCSWESQAAPWAGCGESFSRAPVCCWCQRENFCLSGCGCHEFPACQ